jgi:hypothetical protein
MTQPDSTTNTGAVEALQAPHPDKSPYGEVGRVGSPDAYLIDPGAGSGSDRTTRFWPMRDQLDDIYRRGGSITPLYARAIPTPASEAEVITAGDLFHLRNFERYVSLHCYDEHVATGMQKSRFLSLSLETVREILAHALSAAASPAVKGRQDD